MSKKKILRLTICIMLVVAIVFVLCALSAPNLGRAFYIGPFYIGAEVWRTFYAAYGIIIVTLFTASFFVKNKQ